MPISNVPRVQDARHAMHISSPRTRGTSRLSWTLTQTVLESSFLRRNRDATRRDACKRMYRDSWLVSMTAGKSHRDPHDIISSHLSAIHCLARYMTLYNLFPSSLSISRNKSVSWRSLFTDLCTLLILLLEL